MPFKDRSDAGCQLAKALAGYKEERPVILALPRGGVPVAGEVAAVLSAPLDLILVRKLGVPSQPDLAMGAVVDGGTPIIVRNEDVIRHAGIDESVFNAVCDCELAEIGRRRQRYLGSFQLLHATRMRNPKRMVLAVPVAPTDTVNELRSEADDVVYLEDLGCFGAIGAYYADFGQVSDEEVIDILKRFRRGGSKM